MVAEGSPRFSLTGWPSNMPCQKFAFFALSLGASFALSSIPVVGGGLAFYFSIVVWAVAGFRYWLLSGAFGIMMSLPYTLAASSASPVFTTVGASVHQALASAPGAGVALSLIGNGLLLVLPVSMWLWMRSVRVFFRKRLGSRLP